MCVRLGVARALWYPLLLAVAPIGWFSTSPHPAVAGLVVPPLSPPSGGGGGRGWFPGLPPTITSDATPPRQKSAPPCKWTFQL